MAEGLGAFERILKENLPKNLTLNEKMREKCALFEKKIAELQTRLKNQPAEVRVKEEQMRVVEDLKEKEQEYDVSEYETSSDEEFFSKKIE